MTVSGDTLPGPARQALLLIARRRTLHLKTLTGMCPPYLVRSLVVQGLITADGPIEKNAWRTLLRITDEGLARARLLPDSEGL